MLVIPTTRGMLAHLLSGLRAQDRAAAMRLEEYAMAWRLLQEHPWLGVGFGPAPELGTLVGVSSIYLHVAERAGIFALAALLGAVGAVGVTLWRARRHASPVQWVVLGSGAGLAGALITGLFDQHYVAYPHMATLFWLTTGLGVAAASCAAGNHPEEQAAASAFLEARPRQAEDTTTGKGAPQPWVSWGGEQ